MRDDWAREAWKMKILELQDLDRLYKDGESSDQELFAEQRSNLLLVAGDHYTRKGSKFWTRIRDNRQLAVEQKLRLTKNHVQKIVKAYVNSITTYSPGVDVVPKNETELQDQKNAELNQAVWQDVKQRHKFKMKVQDYANDYVGIGESAVKIFWDPMAGEFLGYKAQMKDDDTGPELDDEGKMIPTEEPVFKGDFVYERWYGFNIIRDAGAKSFQESPFLAYRKMIRIQDLKPKIMASPNLDEEEKENLISKLHQDNDDTYMVFDGTTAGYKIVKDQVMLREFYFRPCANYPQGYYYITTKDAILFQDELPFGVWPIAFTGFDEIQTTPRYHSIVKHLRPYQMEVNRSASKIAEHQITLGDDKLLVQNGTKITPGSHLPGVRTVNYTGMAPTILGGRSGEQYLDYMNSQISEMYAVAMIQEAQEEKDLGQMDPYALLFRSLKEKKKYSSYTDKFEQFLADICQITLKLAKKYYTNNHLVPAIGRREFVNIDEFRTSDDLGYHIKLEPQSEDIESKFGKQLTLNHILQYTSGQLKPEDIGKIIRLMPYVNEEQMLGDMTLDYDISTNYLLALDRGQTPKLGKYDNHDYIVKRMTARMRQPDFIMLAPQIQNNYENVKQQHEQMIALVAQQLKQAQSEFIPSGGYQVACDLYVSDPTDPKKLPKRVRIPSESVQWLLKQLDSQGTTQQQLAGQNQGVQAELAGMIGQNNQPGRGMPQGQVAPPPMTGQSQAPRSVLYGR